ncbi:MAG: ATP-binding protein [Candidatus Hodarchaeales archaeon]|jgi:CO dehydrogenase maturation factor
MTSIAIVGKGGVGKTFTAANLARLFAREEKIKVIAIDMDSNPTLAMALGVPEDKEDLLVPITERSDLVRERTELPGAPAGTFKLNPQVSDLLDTFSLIAPDNVRLLVAGAIRTEQGCMCGAHALVRTLLRHLVYSRSELVIFDMEAGLENFSRGTLKNVNHLIIVSEPSRSSITTLKRIVGHARDLNLPDERIWVIFNKWPDSDKQPLQDIVDDLGIKLLGVIPFTPEIASADIKGVPFIHENENSSVIKTIQDMKNHLLDVLQLDKIN